MPSDKQLKATVLVPAGAPSGSATRLTDGMPTSYWGRYRCWAKNLRCLFIALRIVGTLGDGTHGLHYFTRFVGRSYEIPRKWRDIQVELEEKDPAASSAENRFQVRITFALREEVDDLGRHTHYMQHEATRTQYSGRKRWNRWTAVFGVHETHLITEYLQKVLLEKAWIQPEGDAAVEAFTGEVHGVNVLDADNRSRTGLLVSALITIAPLHNFPAATRPTQVDRSRLPDAAPELVYYDHRHDIDKLSLLRRQPKLIAKRE